MNATDQVLTFEQVQHLIKFSGMIYHQVQHTPEKWEQLTGARIDWLIDRRLIKTFGGLCYWTEEAEKICKAYLIINTHNWNVIGISAN